MKQSRFLYVTAMAALLLLLETVLFHVVEYLFDYFSATGVISWAVLGIGLGAMAASKVHGQEDRVFLWCSLGAALSLYVTSFVITRYTVIPLIAVCVSLVFFFPVVFIALAFRRHPADRIYLFDMAGAGLGVVITVVLYWFLRSEGIIILCMAVFPALGAIRYATSKSVSPRAKTVATIGMGALSAAGMAMFFLQVGFDSFNIVKLFDSDGPYSVRKVFRIKDPTRIARSYDSLVGRIDLLTFPKRPGFYAVCYNGYGNDGFDGTRPREYSYYKRRRIRWPSADQRVFYGLKEAPRFFVIGSAARGITKTIKKLTPVENIVATEIDPSIVEIMSRDFYEASGMAYKGLHPIVGNALSVLKSLDQKFDVITLINTHSGRTIGYASGPDYLHTRESYHLYMDHLTRDGYVLYEERPFNRRGELGVYRMINTMWHVLKERGAEDPSRHFLLWDWQASRAMFPTIDLRYDPGTEQYHYREGYYKGMIVTREPILGKRREKVMEWLRLAVGGSRVLYLKDVLEYGEVSDFFGWIEKGDLSKLESEGFDSSLVTNDRPFPSLSRTSVPQVTGMLAYSAMLFVFFGILCLYAILYRADHKRGTVISLYNILIGFAYFFIEIMFLQVYQNVFVSPSSTLVLVLGILLMSSGLGGAVFTHIRPSLAAAALVPLAVAAVYAPTFTIDLDLPFAVAKILGVALVFASGVFMGTFFPKGLGLAGLWGMKEKVPYLFAINSVAGSFAVVLALYSGIKLGYSVTIVAALFLYALAAITIEFSGATKKAG